jgi:diguanylate cyclase
VIADNAAVALNPFSTCAVHARSMKRNPIRLSRWLDLSPYGRGRVIVASLLVTLACIGLSVGLTQLGLGPFNGSELLPRLVTNVVVPVVVAFPTMYFLMSKIRELAIAHRELQVVASTDSLTAVLSRGAFTMLVDAFLERVEGQTPHVGALLVVDVDNFKAINDRAGHDGGDEALRIIAASISGVLRGADTVGRIGGDEFGVFLPGSTPAQAEAAAERIRTSVSVTPFRTASGEREPLSVSVGGATFKQRVKFDRLFKAADLRLYEAKHAGRNRISIAPTNGLAVAA